MAVLLVIAVACVKLVNVGRTELLYLMLAELAGSVPQLIPLVMDFARLAASLEATMLLAPLCLIRPAGNCLAALITPVLMAELSVAVTILVIPALALALKLVLIELNLSS